MEKITRVIGVLFLLLIFLSNYVSAKESEIISDKKALRNRLTSLQIPFIENQGQIKESSVKFYANTFAGMIFVTDRGEIIYNFSKTENKSQDIEDTSKFDFKTPDPERRDHNSSLETIAIRESLVCPEQSKINGMNKSATTVNYFIGDKNNWRTNLQTWQEISMGEVYENIELKLSIHGRNVEKLFTIYPLGSVNDIKLKIDGAETLNLHNDGELEIVTKLGTVEMTKPVAYQMISGEKKYVQVIYNIFADSNSYGFEIGEYDNTKPLIIDPLLASTFIGHDNIDKLVAIATDSSGNIFAVGTSSSFYYPTTPGAYDVTRSLNHEDIVISKFDSNLSTLIASTFIGANQDVGNHSVADIVIDSMDNIFIAGYTDSNDYPTTSGAYDNRWLACCSYSGIISKLNNNLSALLASTYIRGSANEYIRSLSLDLSGNVFVSGYTWSSNFPTTAGAYNRIFNNGINGYPDIFISKLNNNLSSLLASTFVGSGGFEINSDMALDLSENVYIVGRTMSSGFPVTPGAFDTTYQSSDTYISKLNDNLSVLLSSTFIGGYSNDQVRSIALDSSGNVFIIGYTSSTDYPVTQGAYNTQFSSISPAMDIFVSKLTSDLSTLQASTFIGTAGNIPQDDNAIYGDITVDSTGNVYISGMTMSLNYPSTPDAYDPIFIGNRDGFISKLNNDLSTLISSTFMGGSDNDYINALTLDESGNVLITGYTSSSDYPTTEGSYDMSFNDSESGRGDGFLSKLDSDLSLGFCIDNDSDGYGSNGAAECLNGSTIDCDDTNALINPEATEIWYDSIDRNCDGWNDYDQDKDSYVHSSYPAEAGGTSPNTGDCDDTNMLINPGAPDNDCNNIDNNCNSYVDENYMPEPTTCGVGVCVRTGQLLCDSAHSLNDTCITGSPLETPEASCVDVLDNDCDNFIDTKDSNCAITCQNLPARIEESYLEYSTLQQAYDSAGNGETIQIQIISLSENLNANLNKSIYLELGYVCDYSINDGNTTINGNVTITNGEVTIQSGTLEILNAL